MSSLLSDDIATVTSQKRVSQNRGPNSADTNARWQKRATIPRTKYRARQLRVEFNNTEFHQTFKQWRNTNKPLCL